MGERGIEREQEGRREGCVFKRCGVTRECNVGKTQSEKRERERERQTANE